MSECEDPKMRTYRRVCPKCQVIYWSDECPMCSIDSAVAAARREGKREGLEEALTEVEAFSPVWHAIRARLEASE